MPVRRTFLAASLAALTIALAAATAHAAPVPLCIPSGAGAAVTTPQGDGTCPVGTTKQALVPNADLNAARSRIDALETLLDGVTRLTVNSRPTLRISGVNLQLVNGTGQSRLTDGTGNLVIGYNENPGNQSGSHNIIIGRSHAAASWGSLLAGHDNRSTGPGQLLAGTENSAIGSMATAAGGSRNTANGFASSITGGFTNLANGVFTSVTGGEQNTAKNQRASVAGGYQNTADGDYSAVAGGIQNFAGPYAQVTGGSGNRAEGYGSAILGGLGITLASGPLYQRSPGP